MGTLTDLLRAKPLSYFRDLRSKNSETTTPYENHTDSKVLKVTIAPDDADSERKEEIRLLHLQSFAPLSQTSSDEITGETSRPIAGDYFIYYESPAFLAVRDFNNRNNSIVSDLEERLQGCNLYLTMDLLDTQFFPRRAVERFHQPQARVANTLADPIPGAIVGAGLSRVSQQLAIVAGVYQVPMVSPGSTSLSLDNKLTAPSFARTIPTNDADARASMFYLQHVLHVTHHVGLLFVEGEYGESFRQAFSSATGERGVKLVAVSYTEGDDDSVRDALRFLKSTGLRYFFGVNQINYFDVVLELAYEAGLVGEDYVWFLPATEAITEPGYTVPKDRPGLAAAIRGSAVVSVNTQLSPKFADEITRSIKHDTELQEFYKSSHVESFLFDDYNLSNTVSTLSPYSYPGYDATIALGLAAFVYTVTNIILQEDEENDVFFVFRPQLAAIIDFNNKTNPVEEVNPFLFNSGTIDIPPDLPYFEQDENHIPIGFRVIGWLLCFIVFGVSVYCAVWTVRKQKTAVVRAAQPVYMGLLCLGTALMSTSIIPMSLQPPISQTALNGSCMATMWLFVLGFAIAFGSLACKLIRVSLIFHHALQMHRVQIRAIDVAWPLMTLLVVDIVLLAVWTAVSPLKYERVPFDDDLNEFGVSAASYGTCRDNSDSNLSVVFGSLLGCLNFTMVAICNYKAYRSRHIPSNFNETSYIALSMFFLLEAILIFAPILVLVIEDPTADFMIKSFLVAFCCLSILLPMFVSKWRRDDQDKHSVASSHPTDEQLGASSRVSTNSSSRKGTRHVGRFSGDDSGMRVIRTEQTTTMDQIKSSMTMARSGEIHKSGSKAAKLRESLQRQQQAAEPRTSIASVASLGSNVMELRASIQRKDNA